MGVAPTRLGLTDPLRPKLSSMTGPANDDDSAPDDIGDPLDDDLRDTQTTLDEIDQMIAEFKDDMGTATPQEMKRAELITAKLLKFRANQRATGNRMHTSFRRPPTD